MAHIDDIRLEIAVVDSSDLKTEMRKLIGMQTDLIREVRTYALLAVVLSFLALGAVLVVWSR